MKKETVWQFFLGLAILLYAGDSWSMRMDEWFIQAVRKGNAAAVRMMLDRRIPPDFLFSGEEEHEEEHHEHGHEGGKIDAADIERLKHDEVMDSMSASALMWAAREEHIHILEILVDRGANLDMVNADKETALMWAATAGRFNSVLLLLGSGADLSLRDKNGQSALDRAHAGGWGRVASLLELADTQKYLADKGILKDGNDKAKSRPQGAKAKDAKVDMHATHEHHEHAEAGEHKKGSDPLFDAAARGDAKELRKLLSGTSKIDPNKLDEDGVSPLIIASHEGRLQAVQTLLEMQAKINLADKGGRTPLTWAAMDGRDLTMHLLLANGADIRSVDNKGRSALHWAAAHNRTREMAILMDMGAPLNLQDKEGNAPLLMAAAHGHIEAVKLLQSRGANLRLQNTAGQDAARVAALNHYMVLADYLTAVLKRK
ncbi:MAG: ankyrin repeat domain-containing protein [Magnetococcus sp. DMHC-1]|nr:ankyrin repeat domain-containing protein [Magnetococcales bacterium]